MISTNTTFQVSLLTKRVREEAHTIVLINCRFTQVTKQLHSKEGITVKKADKTTATTEEEYFNGCYEIPKNFRHPMGKNQEMFQ